MPTSKEIRQALGCSFKSQPACYQFIWPQKAYVGSTSNMSLRMTDHVACFAKGYKKTSGGQKGQLDLYSQDLRKAYVRVEYCESKQEALRREQAYYQSLGAAGVLYNQTAPKHPRILVYSCITEKTEVFESINEAARKMGLNRGNVAAAVDNGYVVKHHKFFRV